jgi:adenylate cyclase
LASIVAVDIVGFSTMSERDQRNAARKVENLRARIEQVAAKNGGRLFNTAGDGFMLEFSSAGAALGAVQDILDKRLKGEPPIRVGAHVGDVVVTATTDLLGHGVNVAARLQELAEPGTALVSAEFRSMARSSPSAAFQSRGQKPLDNIEQRVQTFEILAC